MEYSNEIIGNNIKNERIKRKMSQSALGKKVGVVGKQICNYEKGILKPPTDVLNKLCIEFNCEMGYLLGEEEYSGGTKLTTAMINELGLDLDSINAIKKLTHSSSDKEISLKKRKILNKLLTSSSFDYLLDCMADLDVDTETFNSFFNELYEKYSDEQIEKAFYYYKNANWEINSDIPKDISEKYIINVINDEEIDPIFKDIIKDIDNKIDKQRAYSYNIKVDRYELNESFGALIDEMFPKSNIKEG